MEKKAKLMTTHPLKLLIILLLANYIDKNILNDFENSLYKIINFYIKVNIENYQSGKKYFSFVGSSLLFSFGYSTTQKRIGGEIKLIDFGHPVNFFMDRIKLKETQNNKILVIKSLFDYSMGVINLYFMITYLEYFFMYKTIDNIFNNQTFLSVLSISETILNL